MLINLWNKFELFFFISSKKFQAKTSPKGSFFLILFLDKIGILTPGINFPCLSLLSSTIKSI